MANPMDNRSDEDIVLDFQSGHEEAIQMIFSRYKTRILNFCLRLLGNRADAEDATAEVFLTLFAKKYAFNPQAKFSTWLFTVARNSSISRIRKRKQAVSLWFQDRETETWQHLEPEDQKDQSREFLERGETADHVRWAISQLPYEQREAIVLREYHDFKYEQIAQILNCSLEKVKILLFRAREQLRIELASFVKEGQK